ncbi:splicing factor-like protein 1 [Phoenix dactylifera]|uniref:Branchpoint-bridging protein n=1 Tax=Phoenix dactylifera TaxID=42345 RepID=A0A8B7CUR4_PHODC|nr:splicing factor-like protein 1 [Phoenix dactylifera]
MGKQRVSVDQNSPIEIGCDDEHADVENQEPGEEDNLSEEEFCEEEPDEEPHKEEPNEEEKPCEEELNQEEEPGEEEYTERETCDGKPTESEPSEALYNEPGEEHSSPNDCSNNEKHQLNSSHSSSEKKRRSADRLEKQVEKRQKQDHDSKPEFYASPSGTDPQDKPSNLIDEVISSKEQENSGSSGKKRPRRWDTKSEADGAAFDGGVMATKKRKKRWVIDDSQLKMLGPLKLPDFVNWPLTETLIDPEIQKLNAQLLEINQKLKARELVDDQKLITKLIEKRQKIISELIQRNPTFKPPMDYKPAKLYRKLYIPVEEYPGYNFLGLIIGPRGHTQKRMEKETGARILVRGKGSAKGRKVQQHTDAKYDPSENEDLHVYIEADTQQSLDAAVQLVEKLLVPVEEEMNEHKHAQLRELAELKGKVREDSSSRNEKAAFQTNVSCNICSDVAHLTAACPLTGSAPGARTNEHQVSFLAELGGDGISFSNGLPVSSSTVPWTPNPASHSVPASSGKPFKEIDESKLFVGYLPRSVNTNKLIELFSPFGRISEAVVIKDKKAGLSKGYGFVRYTDPTFAAEAVRNMHGYRIEGKMLAVRVAGCPPPTVNTNLEPGQPPSIIRLPTYPSSAAIAQRNPHVLDWPGPRGAMQPEAFDSFPKNSSFVSHIGPVSEKSPVSYGASGQIPVLTSVISAPMTASREFEQFLSYVRGFNSQDYLYQSFPFEVLPSPQVHFTRSFGSHHRPFLPVIPH